MKKSVFAAMSSILVFRVRRWLAVAAARKQESKEILLEVKQTSGPKRSAHEHEE